MSIELWKLIATNSYPIKNTPWTLTGFSRAARNTFIYIPELGIAFDAGLATEVSPTHIFISHAHIDHVGELYKYFIDPANGTPTVIIPKPSAVYIRNFVQSAIQMTKHNFLININWNVIEASNPTFATLEPVYLPNYMIIKNIKFMIELFKCSHTITTTGYGLIEIRSKLKTEYKDLSQSEINALKNDGVQICDEILYHHFCYLGDTDHHILYTDKMSTRFNPNLEKYNTIMIECTFLYSDKTKQAKKNKHMLWDNLRPFIEAHPNITFILYHFSMCYRDKEIIRFFENINLPNVIPLVSDFEKLYTDAVINMILNNNYTCTNLICNALNINQIEQNINHKYNNDNNNDYVDDDDYECCYISE